MDKTKDGVEREARNRGANQNGAPGSHAQEQRKTVLRRKSADTQEYEPYQLRDTGRSMNVDEEVVERSFVPRAVSFAGLREPCLRCDWACQGEGFRCWDMPAEMVEESVVVYALNLCVWCYNQRLEEKNGSTWKRLVSQKRSRGNLEIRWSALGLQT